MLTIQDLTKSFGARDLFRGAELQVGARDRVAIVGPNGSGKTTLFDMIAGEQQPDGGAIRLPRDAVVGYLRQETDKLRGKALLDEVLSAGGGLRQAEHRLSILEHEIAETDEEAERERLLQEYGDLQHRFSMSGGYAVEFDAKRILGGLGFGDQDFARRTETFSGGMLMRIALAKLLLAGPDLLMLDEPTNHLDVESVEWLERFLRGYDGAVLVISHDRDFINGLTTKVVEIEEAALVSYAGDYASFVEQREERARQALAAVKNQQRKVAHAERFIERFRYKATKARQVQSRIKSLERMERPAHGPSKKKAMHLAFPPPPRSGNVVLDLRDVSFSYGDKPVYRGLDFAIERGQKVALVGPNGAGKTTLLKLLAGVLEPAVGERAVGHNVSLGYFAQHQIEALVPENTVLTELQRAIPPRVEVRPRDLLGRFLFSGDDVDKRVAVLSGGEQTRLALARLLVTPANFLCLDEPTNHLDMQSRDVLEDALTEYSGSLVLITHDRHLIRSVANRIVEVVNGRITVFHGDYDYYLGKRIPHDEPAEEKPQRVKPKDRRRREAEGRARTKDLRDRVRKVEAELEHVAGELREISAILADPDVYASGTDVAELVKKYEFAKRRSARLESAWEEATTALEAVEDA